MSRSYLSAIAFCALVSGGLSSQVNAGTIELNPTQDVTWRSAYGLQETTYLSASKTKVYSTYTKQRGLMMFDLPDGLAPEDILSAELKLYITSLNAAAPAQYVYWGLYASADDSWTETNVPAASIAQGEQLFSGTMGGYTAGTWASWDITSSWDMARDLAAADGKFSLYAKLGYSEESSNVQRYIRFASSEDPNGLAPTLVLHTRDVAAPVPLPAAALSGMIGLGAIALAGWVKRLARGGLARGVKHRFHR